MDDEMKKRIATLVASGATLLQVRRMMAVTDGEFNKAIREMRRDRMLPRRKTVLQRIAEDFDNGERNPYVLCERYGITMATLNSYKHRLGVTFGKRPSQNYKHSPRTIAIIEDFRAGDMSVAEVAKKHGVSWTYAKKVKSTFVDGKGDGEL